MSGMDFALSYSALLSKLTNDNHILQRIETMKKLMVQLFVVSVLVASYVLPVLAEGGGGM
jgi:hypothetical protein